MRLLIAGILSLIIYLMTCGYKNEENTGDKVFTAYPCEEQRPELMKEIPLLILFPDPFNLTRALPLYFWYFEDVHTTQTFPDVRYYTF